MEVDAEVPAALSGSASMSGTARSRKIQQSPNCDKLGASKRRKEEEIKKEVERSMSNSDCLVILLIQDCPDVRFMNVGSGHPWISTK